MNTPIDSNKKRKPITIIFCFLLLLVIESAVICILLFIEKPNNDVTLDRQKSMILIVDATNDDESELSDSTQIANAVQSGGMIKISPESEWISSHFPPEYIKYGAMNSNGIMWTEGAYLNYIASMGWQLIAVENKVLYFTQI